MQNFREIVRENFGVDPDLSDSSPLVKGAKRLYELVKKKKNARQSKETVIKCEEAILKAFEIELGSAVVKKNDDETRGTKRKNFDELKSKVSKIARVKNVIEILDNDRGLEEKVRTILSCHVCP